MKREKIWVFLFGILILFSLNLISASPFDYNTEEGDSSASPFDYNTEEGDSISTQTYYINGSNINASSFSTACSGTNKVSNVTYSNFTGLFTIICTTDETSAGGTEPLWSANYTLFNSSWSSIVNTSYYLQTNPFSFYNITSWNNPYTYFNLTNFPNYANVYLNTSNQFSYFNLTNFPNYANVYLNTSNQFTYWNSTFATFNKTYADTLYQAFGNVTNTSYLLKTGDTATGNYTFDSPTLHIDSTNNMIGIGTINPRYPLHIKTTGGASSSGLLLENTGSQYSPNLEFNNSWGQRYIRTENGTIYFLSKAGAVVNSFSNTGDTVISGSLSISSLYVSSSADTTFNINSTGVNTLSQILLIGRNGSANQIWYLQSRGGKDSPANRLSIFDTGAVERFTILTGGNVGIGVINPQNKLNVVGDANVTGVAYRNNKALIDWSEAINGTTRLSTNNTFYGNVNINSAGNLNITAGNSTIFLGRIKLGIDSQNCAGMVSGEICRNSTGTYIKQ